jgi:menaquinone-dependent protoporphyrinogen IX oxidase
MSLLVIHASRHGATAGIAARIATRLVDSGASVDLRPVVEVETVDAYDAVVLGAPEWWPAERTRAKPTDPRFPRRNP